MDKSFRTGIQDFTVSWQRWITPNELEEEDEVSRPANAILQLLEDLSADWSSVLQLSADSGITFWINAAEGRYHVSLQSEDDHWVLLGDPNNDALVKYATGGQPVEFPARQLTSLAQARQATEHFLRTGERDPGLFWESTQ